MVRNSYQDGLRKAFAVHHRQQIEAPGHKTMFRILNSFISIQTSVVFVLHMTVNGARLPHIFAEFFSKKCRTLVKYFHDVCAVIIGIDSFRTLSGEEDLVNCLSHKRLDLDPMPASNLRQYILQLTLTFTEIINLLIFYLFHEP